VFLTNNEQIRGNALFQRKKSMKQFRLILCVLVAPALTSEPGCLSREPRDSSTSSWKEGGGMFERQDADLPASGTLRFSHLRAIRSDGSGISGIIRFSQNGTIMAVSRYRPHENGDVVLWDTRTWSRLQVLPHPERFVTSIAFVPPGDRLVTACRKRNEVLLWDIHRGNLIRSLSPPGDPTASIAGLAAFPGGKRLLCSTKAGLIVWQLDGNTYETLDLGKHVRVKHPEKGSVASHCSSVAFTADGARFATHVDDIVHFTPKVLIWDANVCRVTNEIPLPNAGREFAFAPDGRSVAISHCESGGQGASASVWDVTSGRKMLSGELFRWGLFDLAYSSDGKYLFAAGQHRDPWGSGAEEPSIGVWELATGRLVARLPTHAGTPLRMGISPDGKLLAVPGPNVDIYAIEHVVPPEGR
jgi:WD40 repeat protein